MRKYVFSLFSIFIIVVSNSNVWPFSRVDLRLSARFALVCFSSSDFDLPAFAPNYFRFKVFLISSTLLLTSHRSFDLIIFFIFHNNYKNSQQSHNIITHFDLLPPFFAVDRKNFVSVSVSVSQSQSQS